MGFGSNLSGKLGKKGGVSKTIKPGNVKARVYGISTSEATFKGVDKLFLHLHLETEPIGPDFQGFLIDKDDESKGRFVGQIGNVKSSGFGYDDNRKDKDGNIITKEDSVIMFLDSLCNEAGSTWVKDVIEGRKFNSMEEFIKGFNKELPIKDVYLNWCIGGTQDTDENGYPKYWLNLPKFEKGFRLFATDENKSTLLPYEKEEHLYVKEQPKNVNNFSGGDDDEEVAQVNFSETDDEFDVTSDDGLPFDMGDDDDADTFAVSE